MIVHEKEVYQKISNNVVTKEKAGMYVLVLKLLSSMLHKCTKGKH